MLRKLGMAFAIIGAMLATPVLAKDEVRLKAVTPWHVEWTVTSCTLSRGFGDVSDPQVLKFEQFSLGTKFQLLVVSNALRRFKQKDSTTLTYAINDDDTGYAQKLPITLMGTNAKRTPTLFVPGSHLFGDTISKARTIEASITQVRVESPTRKIIFETGPLAKAFDAMRLCTEDLVKSWGLNLEKLRALSQPPRPQADPNTWLKPSDYPRGALIIGEQALIAFRLLVDSNGNPTDCLIQQAYADDNFKIKSCEILMKRAKFYPALDANGEPTNAFYASTITWYIK